MKNILYNHHPVLLCAILRNTLLCFLSFFPPTYLSLDGFLLPTIIYGRNLWRKRQIAYIRTQINNNNNNNKKHVLYIYIYICTVYTQTHCCYIVMTTCQKMLYMKKKKKILKKQGIARGQAAAIGGHLTRYGFRGEFNLYVYATINNC